MEINPDFGNTFLEVYLNKGEPGLWRGHVCGPLLAAPLVFDDLSGLLLQVDAQLDAWNFPRAYQRKRTFAAPGARTARRAPVAQAGGVDGAEYAFTLHVSSRRHTSWQGVIDWRDGRKAEPFESELELLRLLEQRLER